MNKENTQPMPTSQWLAEVQAKVGVPDNKLAYAMGYESPMVIELMKSGQMRVPVNKTMQLAWVLRLKPGVVLRRLLEDIDSEPKFASLSTISLIFPSVPTGACSHSKIKSWLRWPIVRQWSNCRFSAGKNAPHFCRLTWATRASP